MTIEPRERARLLVVEDGLTLSEAAESAGLSLSYLQKLSAEERWQEQRRQREKALQSYAQRVRDLKDRTLNLAIAAVDRDLARTTGVRAPAEEGTDLPDSDTLLKHWRALETAWPERHYQPPEHDPEARRRAMLECLELIIGYATDRDRNLLAMLEPHIHPIGQAITEACSE